ncbi:hypothetical protein OK32_003233 [Salmonella enterica subsp. enterica]|nr:hypothetical protein [Salmonella enterica subsp. enterica serovar Hvittingfoss]
MKIIIVITRILSACDEKTSVQRESEKDLCASTVAGRLTVNSMADMNILALFSILILP